MRPLAKYASLFQPTVLFNPSVKSRVSQQEIFGPVICVYEYDNIDQAIEQANAMPYAFQAAIATQNIDTALCAFKHLAASTVMINDHTAFRVDWMPFPGCANPAMELVVFLMSSAICKLKNGRHSFCGFVILHTESDPLTVSPYF
jgi:acyl-CoA reductase-like NAD-dependent aldehyde dehydrogenase